MGRFDRCLLASDIDGTLITGKLFPERNIRKIQDFVNEGGSFSLSTGRTVLALGDITSKIECISPSVLSNGCVIYDFKKDEPISEKLLPENTLKMVQKVIDESGVGVEIHTAKRAFVPNRSAMTDLHELYENMSAEFVSFEDIAGEKVNKVIYFIENETQGKEVRRISEEYKGECDFYDTCAFINGVKQNYIEQLPKGVSKAQALKELCRILDVKDGGFFAIGDYYNDVPMLKSADISAVPLEAPEDVKSAASMVVGSVAGGAVADFIKYLEEVF